MNSKKRNHQYSFEQFNQEINELYNYIKENKFSDEEISKIFTPITNPVLNVKRKLRIFLLVLIIFMVTLWLFSYLDLVYWHLSAIARIFIIKMLPYFDWTHLKNQKCLIENNLQSQKWNEFNCDLCENLKYLDVYNVKDGMNENILVQKYIDLHIPLILTDGIHHWPQNVQNFTNFLKNESTIYESYPCSISTNIYNGIATTGKVMDRIPLFSSFFLHFQNCEYEAMKAFRSFTYRPDFLPPTYSPIKYNWLIWNKNYDVKNYKRIDLVEKLTIVGQVIGETYFKLIPRHSCEEICPIMDVKLKSGESLLFTSLWNLEYRPNESGENIAVILETRN